ncbi:MAG: T9SS type A sorting domain-containing protein [bacterium]
MKKILLLLLLMLALTKVQAHWEPDVRLTYDEAASGTSWNNAKSIASSGDTIHIVWYDSRDGNGEIYYKRSTDCGLSWDDDFRLTNDFAGSQFPSIAVLGSYVHIVWFDNRDLNNEIYYKRSSDGGTSWSEDIGLTANDSAHSWFPSLSVSGNMVHVVWYDVRDGNMEIYYKRSIDAGISWENDVRLSENNVGDFRPSIESCNDYVHVVWFDFSETKINHIYYKRSTDGGLTFEPEKLLTEETINSTSPCITVSDTIVSVVYLSANKYVNYLYSTNSGLNWGKEITVNPHHSYQTSIASSGSKIHILFNDNRKGYSDIYYKYSSDGGISWGNDTLLSNNLSTSSDYPSICVSNLSIHLIWTDLRDGLNGEIYYKRNPTGNIVNVSEEYNKNFFGIYPNPASDLLEIKLSESSELSESYKINIYNMHGKCVSYLTPTLSASREGVMRIDISQLPVGMYFVITNSGNSIDRNRFVILR